MTITARMLATPSPESFTAIIDSREQLPFALEPLQSVRGTLQAGDYSVCGLDSEIAIERKSLSDLIACCGTERARFERELQKLLAYRTRAVVVEASWSDLSAGGWRSKLPPESATGSVLAWIGQGVPFLFCGSREAAQRATVRLLGLFAN
jgi:ERCC4-type nuclease